ncbi:AmiS/UreI family transporter [Parafrigoribacterium mesophilum]|uniref:AmiS/UreI family transporter n=1 Tax=Parafrigoribacterium mesophilum TaxID=433646 RepID=UPI0031FCC3BB
MGNAGLFFVGIVLLVNGLVILNIVPTRSAAVLNLFVGALQVLLPTIILIQSGGDQAIINATWPTYLFGFTYLYYGLGIFLNLEPQGLGWFSAFVAAVALYEAAVTLATDPVFAVIWLCWAAMWALFFLLMALDKASLSRFTAWFLVWLGIPSCSISGLFLLNGAWDTTPAAGAAAFVALLALTAISVAFTRSSIARPTDASDNPAGTVAPDAVPAEAVPVA